MPPSPPPDAPDARSPRLLVVTGPIARDEDIRGLCDRLRAAIAAGGARTVVCDVRELAATCRAIEALARLQLTARRNGRSIRLQRASPELEQLLQLTGLAGVVPTGLPASSPLRGRERLRQAEQREDAGRVEEAVDRFDPPL